jgi:mono/diheme cytochrome c family protein
MKVRNLAIPLLIAAGAFVVLPKAALPKDGDNELSGAQMYRTYCASCHGIDGRGAGPVAPALKVPVPDLTLVARRNKGVFPDARIVHIIDGFEIQAVHGTRDMPVWGDYFRDNASRDEAILKLREHNLTEYIRSIQR